MAQEYHSCDKKKASRIILPIDLFSKFNLVIIFLKQEILSMVIFIGKKLKIRNIS